MLDFEISASPDKPKHTGVVIKQRDRERVGWTHRLTRPPLRGIPGPLLSKSSLSPRSHVVLRPLLEVSVETACVLGIGWGEDVTRKERGDAVSERPRACC